MKILKGIAVSPGVAVSPAIVLDSEELVISRRIIAPAEVEAEVARLHAAVEKSVQELTDLREKVS